MRICHSFRIIYFSIPKTGSESVRRFLDDISEEKIVSFPEIDARNPFYSHMRPHEAEATFLQKGWNFERYFKIVTVRNPWSRLASLYTMTCRNYGDEWRMPFSEWINSLDPSGQSTSDMPAKWYAHGTMSMTRFMSRPDGRSMVDQVFRIEDQRDAFCRKVSALTEGKVAEHDLSHTNRARRPYDWRDMYSENDRNMVAELYADDIRNFGYSFDDTPQA